MGGFAGAIRVAATAVKRGGKTARGGRASLKARTMASSTGRAVVSRSIATVINVSIRPTGGVDDEWWTGIEGVAGVATDSLSASC